MSLQYFMPSLLTSHDPYRSPFGVGSNEFIIFSPVSLLNIVGSPDFAKLPNLIFGASLVVLHSAFRRVEI